MTTESDQTTATDPGHLLPSVLDDLAELVQSIPQEQFDDPTPCPDFNVAALRAHILGWVTYFATALSDADKPSERPDPSEFSAPDDPTAAADVVRAAARRISKAVRDGVADQPVTLLDSTMPGSVILGMTLGEYLVHGSDLAKSTGKQWDPPTAATLAALDFMPGMLTDEYRGEDQSFGYQVEVGQDAPPLDRLLGFCGRNPAWTA